MIRTHKVKRRHEMANMFDIPGMVTMGLVIILVNMLLANVYVEKIPAGMPLHQLGNSLLVMYMGLCGIILFIGVIIVSRIPGKEDAKNDKAEADK